MQQIEKGVWETLEQAYAFIGNSLLAPMTQTSDIGISVSFWKEFPRFENEHVENGLNKLIAYTSQDFPSREKAVERCSVEYTKLFVGPPEPAAPPWETMSRAEGVSVGFGQATIDMRAKLAEIGLKLDNENNQYEDHMGIELLYLSVLCGKIAQACEVEVGEATGEDSSTEDSLLLNPSESHLIFTSQDAKAFIEEYPLGWIKLFRSRIDEAYPEGYFTGLVELAQGILEWQVEEA